MSLSELEVLEMAHDGYRFDAHAFMRKVMTANPCHCGKPASMLVSFRETMTTPAWMDDLGDPSPGSRGNQPVPATIYYPLCMTHWLEAREHPHYHGAEEL